MSKKGGKDNERFAALPERALYDARLSLTHHRVLGKIALHDGRSLTNGGTGCTRSHRGMANELRVDFANFSRAVKELLLWGYASQQRNPRNKRQWIYRVTYTGKQIIEAATKRIVGTGANEIVGTGANDQAEIVGTGANISLVSSEKNGNQNNGLTSTLDPTRSIKEEKSQKGEASPSPCNSRASASPEKKEASKEEPVLLPFTPPPTPKPPEGSISKEERESRVAQLDELKRQLRRGSAK
jgi:DNA-binding MarR family transcriptional regulator